MWNRGYRSDDLRLYLDGYLAAPDSNAIEPYLIHRLRRKLLVFYDPYNLRWRTRTRIRLLLTVSGIVIITDL